MLSEYYEANSLANYDQTSTFFMAVPNDTVMHHVEVIFLVFTLNGVPVAWFDLELESGYVDQNHARFLKGE